MVEHKANHLMLALQMVAEHSPLSHIECSYHNSTSIQTWGLYSGAKTTESRIIDNSFSIGVFEMLWTQPGAPSAHRELSKGMKNATRGALVQKIWRWQTNTTNKQPFIIYIIKDIDILSMWNCLHISSIKDVHIWLWITLYLDFSDPKDT
jgi:hypothetical protein